MNEFSIKAGQSFGGSTPKDGLLIIALTHLSDFAALINSGLL